MTAPIAQFAINKPKFPQLVKNFLKKSHYVSIALISVFLIIFLLVFGPIIFVELRFQTKKILIEYLKIENLAQLFIPNFDTLSWFGTGNNREFGIHIPVIYLDEPVVFNVDANDEKAYKEALKKGIAHASGTNFPNTGSGLGYYFAHSSSQEFVAQYNAVFYLLGKLKDGDEIYIWHNQQRYDYVVYNIQVTSAKDTSFIKQQYSKDTIVLQTCWPPGTTHKRLLVFAKRK